MIRQLVRNEVFATNPLRVTYQSAIYIINYFLHFDFIE